MVSLFPPTCTRLPKSLPMTEDFSLHNDLAQLEEAIASQNFVNASFDNYFSELSH
jgi:hypothetical protein